MTAKAYARLNLLRAIANPSKRHNATLLAQLYNSTIRTIVEHSSICIISAANTHLEKLQMIQNEALRIILKVPSYMPIARMNDSANQKHVREHLKLVAKEKIRRLYDTSPFIKATVHTFRSIRSSQYNTSPLDIIQI